jgi:hypothetical protein
MRRLARVITLALVASLVIAASAQAAYITYKPPFGNQYLGPGTTFTVSWSEVQSPTPKDWIALYPSGAADSGYITWVYTTGTAAGSTEFTIPRSVTPGAYELRMFSNNSYTRLGVAGLGIAPSTQIYFGIAFPHNSSIDVVAGMKATVAWGSVLAPSKSDWVGLYAEKAANDQWISYQYTDGSSTGSMQFPIPAGLTPSTFYEFRMFSDNSYTPLSPFGARFITATAALPKPTVTKPAVTKKKKKKPSKRGGGHH